MKSSSTIFRNNGHQIFFGDALHALNESVADSSVNLIFADPPYNIGKNFNGRMDKWPSDEAYLEWCYKWIDLCLRKLKPSGSFYLMCSTQCLPHFDLYVNIKTRAANRGSKSRSSFANIYALYVLIEDYIAGGFHRKGDYSKYDGAIFTKLFHRQRELPFGGKLQNHAFNNRLNGELIL